VSPRARSRPGSPAPGPTGPHPTPPRAAGRATQCAYTHLDGKARHKSPRERDHGEAAHRGPWRDLPDRYGPRKTCRQRLAGEPPTTSALPHPGSPPL
jgi:hypothetical protein